MLFTYFMIGVAFAIPELVLVKNCAPLRRLIERNGVYDIIFSLALGVFMAWAMGIPAGVTIAIGNVFSTIITKIWYSLKMFDKIDQSKLWWSDNKDDIAQTGKDLVTTAKAIVRIITAPVRFCRACKVKYNAIKAHIPHRSHA